MQCCSFHATIASEQTAKAQRDAKEHIWDHRALMGDHGLSVLEQNSFLARGLLAITMFNFIAPVSAARSSDAAVPDWEKAAGGKMEFEVASIR